MESFRKQIAALLPLLKSPFSEVTEARLINLEVSLLSAWSLAVANNRCKFHPFCVFKSLPFFEGRWQPLLVIGSLWGSPQSTRSWDRQIYFKFAVDCNRCWCFTISPSEWQSHWRSFIFVYLYQSYKRVVLTAQDQMETTLYVWASLQENSTRYETHLGHAKDKARTI